MSATYCLAVLLCVSSPDASTWRPAPLPRPVLREDVRQWTSQTGLEGWKPFRNVSLARDNGCLTIRPVGGPPSIHHAVDFLGGDLDVLLTLRASEEGVCRIGWMTAESPRIDDEKTRDFALLPGDDWHDYCVRIRAPGHVTSLWIEHASTRAVLEIQKIQVVRHRRHPLGVDQIERLDDAIRFLVSNGSVASTAYATADQLGVLGAGESTEVTLPLEGGSVLEPVVLRIASEGLPDAVVPVFAYHEDQPWDYLTRKLGGFEVDVARDGRLARIRQGETVVALLAPLVHVEGRIPPLEPREEHDSLLLTGEDLRVRLRFEAESVGGQIQILIESKMECEGPVVRAIGASRGAIFAGLEFLGPGEASSSATDIETDRRVRYTPSPRDVTMPLMAVVTERATVTLTWDEMTLQPVFATPNALDAASDHRMALRGERISAVVRVGESPLHEQVAWVIQRRGLPDPPAAPRSRAAQRELSLRALEGALRGEEGWGHAAEKQWPRRFYADMASAQWRLTGQAPSVPELVQGGSHIPNDSIYFVTDRVSLWRAEKIQQLDRLLDAQSEDGSFTYTGRFAESLDSEASRAAGTPTHTTAGYCARYAVSLLEHAHQTGDPRALRAGLAALDYTQRFDVPRGGMYWDVPIHCPDLLAAAYLVWANTRGFELTGDARYREQARRWALRGMPFVYQWGNAPVMLYGTPPAYGATERREPEWFGRPAPWIGVVYGYALTLLAPHDATLEWRTVAQGILHAAEQMQEVDGPFAGCIPDQFDIAAQQPRSWHLSPCGMVSLRAALEGNPAGLHVAVAEGRRLIGPFPMHWHGGTLRVQSSPGVLYQLLLNGARIIDVQGRGEDVIHLE